MREQSGTRAPSAALSAALLTAAAIASVPSATALTTASGSADTTGLAPTQDFRCGAPSALAARLGERYYDVAQPEQQRTFDQDPALSAADVARLATLQRTLAAARPTGGDGYRIECRGASRGEPYPVLWRFELEQIERVETLAGDTLLTAFEDRHDVVSPVDQHLVDDVLVAEVMTLPDVSQWYVGADARTLRSTLRARRNGAATPGAYLIEIDWTLSAIGRDLELVQTRFTNGIASEQAVWRLVL